VPLFDKVVFKLGEGSFTILREGESRNLKSVECNGKPLDGHFVDHSELLEGAVLIVITEQKK
jgi:putative alpha-1,2-mannosidase